MQLFSYEHTQFQMTKKNIGLKSFTNYNYVVDEESEQRFVEENGVNKEIQLRDGR